jgi:hypothetical protein
VSDDILDLIDGALADYTSADAMRWSPEPPTPAPAATVRLEFDGVDFTPHVDQSRPIVFTSPGLKALRAVNDRILTRRSLARAHMAAICDWLTANGIRPADVPLESVPVVTKRWIIYQRYERNRAGQIRVEARPGAEPETVMTVQRVPHRAPPPWQLAPWLALYDAWPIEEFLARWLPIRATRAAYAKRRQARARRRR